MRGKDSDTNTDGTARIMVILAWVAGLGFLTYFFQQTIEKRFNPNSQLAEQSLAAEAGEVSLRRNAKGHYVASGQINGTPVVFLLDTGATDVAIPEALADRLRLVRQAGGFSQTANGVVPVWSTRLDEVRLGGIRMQSVRASIVPSMDADDAVLLGMSFLKHLDWEQTGGLLTIRQRR